MSYSMYIINKKTSEPVRFPWKHLFHGSNMTVGGTDSAYMNVTYNYGKILRESLGGDGLKDFHGKNIRETLEPLKTAIASLGDEKPDDDYYAPTKGNVKLALQGLLSLNDLALDYFPSEEMVWDVC